VDWNLIARATREAFREAVNDWIAKAHIRGGQIRGSAAILTPGVLSSEINLEGSLLQKLVKAQVPHEVAQVFARELGSAWKAWAAGFQMHAPAAYPSFAAFPGPSAPPTPAIPMPLALGNSAGEVFLKAAVLGEKLLPGLRAFAMKQRGPAPDAAIKAFTDWVDTSFQDWRNAVLLVNIAGRGEVLTFAPPYVPVGPVTSGDNTSLGPVFAGPRFGKIVL
jgi:hypothetical protein